MDIFIWRHLCIVWFICDCDWIKILEQTFDVDVWCKFKLLEPCVGILYIARQFCVLSGCKTADTKKQNDHKRQSGINTGHCRRILGQRDYDRSCKTDLWACIYSAFTLSMVFPPMPKFLSGTSFMVVTKNSCGIFMSSDDISVNCFISSSFCVSYNTPLSTVI